MKLRIAAYIAIKYPDNPVAIFTAEPDGEPKQMLAYGYARVTQVVEVELPEVENGGIEQLRLNEKTERLKRLHAEIKALEREVAP